MVRKILFIAAIFLSAGSEAQAALIHQYDFNGNLNDKLGGIPLTARGGEVDSSSYKFGVKNSLTLHENLGKIYTIDMVFQFDTFLSAETYQNILHFRYGSGSDGMSGLYTTHDKFQFEGFAGGSWNLHEPMRITLTREGNSSTKLYHNGVLIVDQRTNISDLTNNSLAFFSSADKKRGEGSVDYIRIYDHALTPDEVSEGVSAPTPVTEPASLAMLGGGLGLLGLMRRRRK